MLASCAINARRTSARWLARVSLVFLSILGMPFLYASAKRHRNPTTRAAKKRRLTARIVLWHARAMSRESISSHPKRKNIVREFVVTGLSNIRTAHTACLLACLPACLLACLPACLLAARRTGFVQPTRNVTYHPVTPCRRLGGLTLVRNPAQPDCAPGLRTCSESPASTNG
jgi:hypothetical protein